MEDLKQSKPEEGRGAGGGGGGGGSYSLREEPGSNAIYNFIYKCKKTRDSRRTTRGDITFRMTLYDVLLKATR